MCLEIVFDIDMVIGIAIIADMMIVTRIVVRFDVFSCVICDIVKAAPVRDFRECVGEGELKVGDGVRISGRFKESEEFGDAFVAKGVLRCKAV